VLSVSLIYIGFGMWSPYYIWICGRHRSESCYFRGLHRILAAVAFDRCAGRFDHWVLFAVLGLNWFIVPIYGAVEFYLTIFKVTSIIGIIMSAVVISGGGGPAQLLGTNLNFQPVPCAQNQIGDQCLLPPGFGCKWSFPSPR
jgi:hypothetical protein